MYFFMDSAAEAVKEMGMRAFLSEGFIDFLDPYVGEEQMKKTEKIVRKIKGMRDEKIRPALGPHALYTVSKESLEKISEFAKEEGLLVHFHLAETKEENEECMKEYGKRPAQFLEELGFLSENLIAAHCVWLDEREVRKLAKHSVKVSHNPVSNMKLAVGKAMPYDLMRKAGMVVSLGTDGCASNNSLDMFQSMKFATLVQKFSKGDQTIMPAKEAFEVATLNGAKALGINAGIIEEGKLADLILIDMKRPEFSPNYDLISNVVYSANGSCVDTVICNGKILMRNRRVKGEEEILKKASQIARDLVAR